MLDEIESGLSLPRESPDEGRFLAFNLDQGAWSGHDDALVRHRAPDEEIRLDSGSVGRLHAPCESITRETGQVPPPRYRGSELTPPPQSNISCMIVCPFDSAESEGVVCSRRNGPSAILTSTKQITFMRHDHVTRPAFVTR